MHEYNITNNNNNNPNQIVQCDKWSKKIIVKKLVAPFYMCTIILFVRIFYTTKIV